MQFWQAMGLTYSILVKLIERSVVRQMCTARLLLASSGRDDGVVDADCCSRKNDQTCLKIISGLISFSLARSGSQILHTVSAMLHIIVNADRKHSISDQKAWIPIYWQILCSKRGNLSWRCKLAPGLTWQWWCSGTTLQLSCFTLILFNIDIDIFKKCRYR